MSKYISAAYGPPSGLTDAERSLLVYLAVQSAAANFGIGEQDAADLLDAAAARGEMRIRGDQRRSYVIHQGTHEMTVLVCAERAALRRLAHPTGQLDH